MPLRTSFVLIALFAGVANAQSPLRAASSGRGTTEVALNTPPAAGGGMGTPAGVIRLDFGQPHLRGRVLHTDSLVPYDRPWRLGANANTMLTTDVDLTVGNAAIPKGAYVLYAIPSRTQWTLVVQRNVGQTAAGYPDSATVARIPLTHSTLPAPIEALTMWLVPSIQPGPARGELRFAWGTNLLSTTWAVR